MIGLGSVNRIWGEFVSTPPQNATELLTDLGRGDESAAQRLLPLVYAELRNLAGSFFRNQQKDQTLQPTALVHEAFLRLVDQTNMQWSDRAHFMAVAALAMRQILTDHARRRGAAKRGGDWARLSLDQAVAPDAQPEVDIERLDAVLTRLEALDERRHRVVLLRFFGGLTVEDAAQVMGVSISTVEGDWRSARAWLSMELSK